MKSVAVEAAAAFIQNKVDAAIAVAKRVPLSHTGAVEIRPLLAPG